MLTPEENAGHGSRTGAIVTKRTKCADLVRTLKLLWRNKLLLLSITCIVGAVAYELSFFLVARLFLIHPLFVFSREVAREIKHGKIRTLTWSAAIHV